MKCEIDWIPGRRKDGKPSVRFGTYEVRHYTKLNTCDLCGKLSTPKRVHTRDLFMRMEDWLVWREFFSPEVRCKFEREIAGIGEHFPHHPMLCMTCWNKWRWVWVAVWEFDELRTLIRKLRRTHAENH